ncbi:RNA-dependent RNA polymerase [Chalcocoris rutilans mononega-like virus 2]|uniref:RNA-dependent RNA polymerase n=1 Tax=Chalcocoris rutilans mononega-like virus 2 TaxID=2973795 RepID=A0A916LKY8_9VIRU|nr:RNA-dependent RNA polymerase [Chalcocoris rutilans mononega-like virus 2]DAZ90593.1 TPA_asm: putative glycoprotein [Chalcocoris rutilans mononega-like virus 2]
MKQLVLLICTFLLFCQVDLIDKYYDLQCPEGTVRTHNHQNSLNECRPIVDSLIAFDCRHPDVTMSRVSLLSPPPCSKPIRQNELVTSTYVQVVQRKKTFSIPYYQCKLIRFITIYQCGQITDYMTGVKRNFIHDLASVSATECKMMVDEKKYISSSGKRYEGLRVNGTNVLNDVLVGSIDNEGDCRGFDWAYGSDSYTRVVVQAEIHLTLQRGSAVVTIEDNLVHLPGGITCPYDINDESCVHPSYGYTYWEMTIIECGIKHWSTIFTGDVNKTIDSQSKNGVFTNSLSETVFAIETIGDANICNIKALKTVHSSLYIVETKRNYEPFGLESITSSNDVDYSLYVNSKFIYFSSHVGRLAESLYDTLSYHKCVIERKTISNLVSLAYLSGPAFAYALRNVAGHTAEIRGEVAHIIKCIPVPVTYESTQGCYSEIPVHYDNTLWYITPRNRILAKFATEVSCNPLLPTQYFLGKAWYTMFPHPIQVPSPEDLSPSLLPTFNYVSPKGLATGGIYTQKTLKDYQNHMVMGYEKTGVLGNMASYFIGERMFSKDGSILHMLDKNDWETISGQITKTTWYYLWLSMEVGAAMFGVWFVWTLAERILNSIIILYESYKLFGFSWRMLLCWWTSLSHYLVMRTLLRRIAQLERERANAPNAEFTAEVENAIQLQRIAEVPIEGSTVANEVVNNLVGYSPLYPPIR